MTCSCQGTGYTVARTCSHTGNCPCGGEMVECGRCCCSFCGKPGAPVRGDERIHPACVEERNQGPPLTLEYLTRIHFGSVYSERSDG